MKAIKKGNYWYLQGTFYCELLERTRTYLFRDYNGDALPFVFKKDAENFASVRKRLGFTD